MASEHQAIYCRMPEVARDSAAAEKHERSLLAGRLARKPTVQEGGQQD